MRNRRYSYMNPRVSVIDFAFLILLGFFPGSILSYVVTLKSIDLYTTHKWIERKPAIYFKCNGENKIFLPDVKKADDFYSFKGEESWQPLTELQTRKCKRCGVYEDLLVSDHVFDEWELCASDFATRDGHHTHFKEKEINITFLCQECSSLTTGIGMTSICHLVAGPRRNMKASRSDGAKAHYIVAVVITIAVVLLMFFVLVALYKHWQKRKRQREQARFMKLFEDNDDMDDELGLREMI